MSVAPPDLLPALRRDCLSRRRYPTRRRAERFSARREVVYRCPHCAGWHRQPRATRVEEGRR